MATDRTSFNGMARFRAQLVCGVCLDFLRKPKLLDCAHSFCQECLEKMIKTVDRDVECPCCRQHTSLRGPGLDGVEALRTNFNLMELVEIVSQQEKVGTLKRATHPNNGDHQAVRQQVDRTECTKHGRPLEFYCENCNELLCSRCLKAHQRHDLSHIDDVLPSHLDSLRSLVQPAFEIAFHAEKKMEELFGEKDAVTDNRDKTAKTIDDFFRQLSEALEERKSAIVSTLRKYTDMQLTKLDEQHQTLLAARTEILEVVGIIESSLQHCEDASILRSEQEMKRNLEKHQESILKITQCASELRQSSSFLQFQRDKSVLSSINELGTLEECVRDPHLNHITVRGTVVINNEDSDIYIRINRQETAQVQTIDRSYVNITTPPPLPPKGTLSPEPRPATESPETRGQEEAYQEEASQEKMVSSTPKTELTSVGGHAKEQALPPTLPLIGKIPLPLPQDSPPIMQPLITVISNDQLSSPDSGEQVYPCGICCTGSYDNLIITDTHNHCIRLLDQEGDFLEKIGSEGKSDGQFMEPVAVAVSKDNMIFVAERKNARVQKVTCDGIHLLRFGHRVLHGHQLHDPLGVAVSPADGNIYVSDKSRVYIYKPNGKYVHSIGRDKFKLPAGIVFDNDGRLLVADQESHCVWSVAADDSQILGTIGLGSLSFPYGVAAASDGSIVVTESRKDRISIFSSGGEFIRCFGRSGSEPGMFNHPCHICINRKGQLIVADEMNQRLQVFELPELRPQSQFLDRKNPPPLEQKRPSYVNYLPKC